MYSLFNPEDKSMLACYSVRDLFPVGNFYARISCSKSLSDFDKNHAKVSSVGNISTNYTTSNYTNFVKYAQKYYLNSKMISKNH